jgi:hypothetical protein
MLALVPTATVLLPFLLSNSASSTSMTSPAADCQSRKLGA